MSLYCEENLQVTNNQQPALFSGRKGRDEGVISNENIKVFQAVEKRLKTGEKQALYNFLFCHRPALWASSLASHTSTVVTRTVSDEGG